MTRWCIPQIIPNIQHNTQESFYFFYWMRRYAFCYVDSLVHSALLNLIVIYQDKELNVLHFNINSKLLCMHNKCWTVKYEHIAIDHVCEKIY